MSSVPIILLGLLVAAAVFRMFSGHWMPITSGHVEVDYRSLTLGGLPMEEIFDPATAVQHPYQLSEPHDPLVLVNAVRFDDLGLDHFGRDLTQFRLRLRFEAKYVSPDLSRWYDNPS
jgi:hypothetical protein